MGSKHVKWLWMDFELLKMQIQIFPVVKQDSNCHSTNISLGDGIQHLLSVSQHPCCTHYTNVSYTFVILITSPILFMSGGAKKVTTTCSPTWFNPPGGATPLLWIQKGNRTFPPFDGCLDGELVVSTMISFRWQHGVFHGKFWNMDYHHPCAFLKGWLSLRVKWVKPTNRDFHPPKIHPKYGWLNSHQYLKNINIAILSNYHHLWVPSGKPT